MKTCHRAASTALAVVLFNSLSLDAATTIVVNFEKHGSADAAGRDEGRVNWTDADLRDDTVCTECFAALELQHYLRKMTGRGEDYQIVDDDSAASGDLILVGGPLSNNLANKRRERLAVTAQQLSELGPEGYCIKTMMMDGCRVLLIAGGGRVGTLYGAYALLDRCGCRWFAPGEINEEAPRIDQVGDCTMTEQPSFRNRGFLAWENRGSRAFLLWMARNRLNYWCVEQEDHALMHKLGIRMVAGLHDAEELFLNPPNPYPYNHATFTGDEQNPADPYPVSPQFQGDADQDNKLSYFESHPEWFAFDGRRRIPGIKGWFGVNYCTSNPHATTEFMKNYLRAIIDGPYRDAQILRFWTLDGGKWCQCDACQDLGTPTDRNLLLVNRLDQDIKRAQAEGKIQRPIEIFFLAYADVLDPPSRPLPPGFDYAACSATFFPIRRCYVHNFDDPACPENDRYLRQLRGWATDPERHYRGQIAIGEYYNVSGYKCLPICFMHTIANDIPYYYETGARHFDYMHVTTDNWGTKTLTNYQMARQVWDVNTGCQALWADYFPGRYGPAAETMRSFYATLEQMMGNVSELKYGLARRLDAGAAELFSNPHLQYRRADGVECTGPTLLEIVEHSRRCRELIDQAQSQQLPPRVRARIEEDERCFEYAERTVAYFHACVEAFQLGRAGRRDEALRRYRTALQLADLLRSDTTSTTHSSSHANAPDALNASRAAGALQRLAKLLGQDPPAAKD